MKNNLKPNIILLAIISLLFHRSNSIDIPLINFQGIMTPDIKEQYSVVWTNIYPNSLLKSNKVTTSDSQTISNTVESFLNKQGRDKPSQIPILSAFPKVTYIQDYLAVINIYPTLKSLVNIKENPVPKQLPALSTSYTVQSNKKSVELSANLPKIQQQQTIKVGQPASNVFGYVLIGIVTVMGLLLWCRQGKRSNRGEHGRVRGKLDRYSRSYVEQQQEDDEIAQMNNVGRQIISIDGQLDDFQ